LSTQFQRVCTDLIKLNSSAKGWYFVSCEEISKERGLTGSLQAEIWWEG